MERLLVRTASAKEFCFANDGLDGQSTGPPAEKRPGDQIMTRADNEFLWMVEKNPQRIHEAVGVPSAAHGTSASDRLRHDG